VHFCRVTNRVHDMIYTGFVVTVDTAKMYITRNIMNDHVAICICWLNEGCKLQLSILYLMQTMSIYYVFILF